MIPESFASLPLPSALLDNLADLGFQTPTPIQAASLPALLAGEDVIAQAKTGSGKTVAFGLALLARLQPSQFQVQALVLCPTRELAEQVSKEIRRLARCLPNIKLLTLCGGTPLAPQRDSLAHGAHVVVGTPGRVLDHLTKGSLSLAAVQTLVLDEADRMLDMGFADEMRHLLQACPRQRQTLLFSATFPEEIRQLSAAYQRQAREIRVAGLPDEAQLTQLFFEVADPRKRLEALLRLLGHYRPTAGIIFCNTKRGCQVLAQALGETGIAALALHGDLEQKERDQTLIRFANRSAALLVATDVAARGLDIKDLPLVINFEVSQEPESHVHRIGRTGRAGASGLALSLVTPGESQRVNLLEDYLGQPVSWSELPAAGAPLRLPAEMVTLCIEGGRQAKVRAGDVLGALTGEGGLAAAQVGKIDIAERYAYVAIQAAAAHQALQRLQQGKLKGRKVKASRL